MPLTADTQTSLAARHDDGVLPSSLTPVCFAFCTATVVYLAAAFVLGQWPADGGVPVDFIGVWAAGRQVLSGLAATSYDWSTLSTVQHQIAGNNFPGFYGWHYPPPFLFVAGFLALFPYMVAHVLWMAISLVPYLAAMRGIVGHRMGYLLGGAVPPVIANVLVGQNGFFTAALVGGTLGLMEKHPVAAGCCLGLLTYKPQFGLLFPLVLIASSRWTVFAAASLSALLVAGVSWLAFGTASWEAFFHWLPKTSQSFLSEGQAEWGKLQSLYALVRVLGGSETLGWILQGALSMATAIGVCLLWRSRAAYALKAAAVATGVVLATPYIYLYDTVLLAIPAAFLVRHGLKTGFRNYELPTLALAAVLLAAFPLFKAPLGFGAALLVAGLVVARVWKESREGQDLTLHGFARTPGPATNMM